MADWLTVVTWVLILTVFAGVGVLVYLFFA
jgi:hypothetical protein